MLRSCLNTVSAKREVALFLLSFNDSLRLLVSGQLSADSSSEFRSQKDGSLLGSSVESTSKTVTLLSVQSSQVAGNVFANTLDLGEFAG